MFTTPLEYKDLFPFVEKFFNEKMQHDEDLRAAITIFFRGNRRRPAPYQIILRQAIDTFQKCISVNGHSVYGFRLSKNLEYIEIIFKMDYENATCRKFMVHRCPIEFEKYSEINSHKRTIP